MTDTINPPDEVLEGKLLTGDETSPSSQVDIEKAAIEKLVADKKVVLANTAEVNERDFEKHMHAAQTSVAEAGKVLKVLQEMEHWKDEYRTWGNYCQQRWGMTTRNALHIIAAGEIGTIVPIENSGQARALLPLKDQPEVMKKVMDAMIKDAASGTKITAKAITAKIAELVPESQPKTRSVRVTGAPSKAKTESFSVVTVSGNSKPEEKTRATGVEEDADEQFTEEGYDRWVQDTQAAIVNLHRVVRIFLDGLDAEAFKDWLVTKPEGDLWRWASEHSRQINSVEIIADALTTVTGFYPSLGAEDHEDGTGDEDEDEDGGGQATLREVLSEA